MILSSSGSSSTSQSGSRIAVVTGSGNLLASFNISEVDVPRVKQGQKTTIILDSISDKTFTGEVVSVDRIGTVTNGVTNYPVVIQFSTQSEDILPNMSATANIIIETKTDVLVVPNAAIVSSSNNQNSVRVLKDGKEVSIPVEIGVSSDTLTEVVSGLNEGDEVITGTLTSGASRTKGQTSPFSSFGGGGIRPR
jgi:macrolide-specific efflux system membrane fusion protein